MNERIAFIGGGNMASAIISGLLKGGLDRQMISVVEPFQGARDKLHAQFGINAQPEIGDFLADARLVVWAVKPQTFREAAQPLRSFTQSAVHLSVAAGIRSDNIAAWLGNERVIRTMPNTPALIGKGITALYARPAVSDADRKVAEQVIQSTGEYLWLDREELLDAVTAISGSGPAYIFYFMEAMTSTGEEMGLSRDQAHRLAVATFVGAGELARASTEPPEVLRQRVTSKGGTTYAAISSMDASGVKPLFARALQAAKTRAQELGDEFGEN